MTLGVSPIGEETLDRPESDPAAVRAALRDIALINAVFGGRAAAAFGVARLLRGAPQHRSLTLVDVGSGSGDIARYLVHRAARTGRQLRPVGIERHPVAARLAQAAGLAMAVADGGRLPFADGSVDLVLASQLLHHLDWPSAVRLVREMDRVARIGAVVADLRRHRAAAAGIWMASFALALHAASRHDAVTSVRRGFTAMELADVMRRAGVRGEVYGRPGYRLVAVWRARHADA